MSNTIIFRFDQDGIAHEHAWVENPWRGAMAIWKTIELRHLPMYVPGYLSSKWWYHPGISPAIVKKRLGHIPSRVGPGSGAASNAIFELADNPTIPFHERIALYTTFDDILVRYEDIPKVVQAFRKFEPSKDCEDGTSLPLQANILERMYARNDCIAVGWQQSSVVTENWGNRGGTDPETDEGLPYNCLSMTDHKWLFEELEKNQIEQA